MAKFKEVGKVKKKNGQVRKFMFGKFRNARPSQPVISLLSASCLLFFDGNFYRSRSRRGPDTHKQQCCFAVLGDSVWHKIVLKITTTHQTLPKMHRNNQNAEKLALGYCVCIERSCVAWKCLGNWFAPARFTTTPL